MILFCGMGWGVTEAFAQAQEQWRYDPKGRCDPFVPLVRDGRLIPCGAEQSPGVSPGSSSNLHLVGILWDPGGNSIAIINDAEVKAGDPIGDYRVAEIRQDAVVLARDGEPLILQITFEEEAKPNEGSVKFKKGRESRGGERR